ncbi:MAG: hypothetical protein PHT60_14915 [Acidiphilium sp.]|nr:hypothetical protein [Acidiphilium sp.]MDD4937053.1 hypothetical protein [Acidiphilium sp.]
MHRTKRQSARMSAGIAIAVIVATLPAYANFSLAAGPKPESSQSSWKSLAFPVIHGFGHNVPLTFALRQIVPKGILVVVRPSVNIQTIRVSWRGGRPWNDVLQSVLAHAGLSATITPVMVHIDRRTPP